MLRIFLTLSIALLAVPLLGMFLAWDVSNELTRYFSASSVRELRNLCLAVGPRSPGVAQSACEILRSARVIELSFLGTLGTTILLLAGCVVAAVTPARHRDRSGLIYLVVTRACFVALAAVFFVQSALLLWMLVKRSAMGLDAGALITFLIAVGAIASSGLIVWRSRHLVRR